MGLEFYVYPRFAVHIESGRTVPIERLRAHCLWHPSVGLDGRMVSGHVLYVAGPLKDAMKVALEGGDSFEAEVDVEGGEQGIAHRLAEPVEMGRYAAVDQLIRAVLERTKKALPTTKQKLLTPLQSDQSLSPQDLLLRLEEVLHQQGLHVLVPILVSKMHQLFTDATEALLPISPMDLKRAPRLCFVLLSTDSLAEKFEGSPWLRKAAELVVLPPSATRDRGVLGFVATLPALKPAAADEHLMGQLATAMHEITGGWPDLADRFCEALRPLRDVDDLRQRLQKMLGLLRAAEVEPERSGELLQLALGDGRPLDDLLPGHAEAVRDVVAHQRPFQWGEHGTSYFLGLLSWDRGLAVPRSRLVELLSRGAARGGPAILSARHPSHPVVRWLHVSDFHFSQRDGSDSAIVLDALLGTVGDLHRHGRELDLIFVTGDVAFSGGGGGAAEYKMAEEFLGRLCQEAGVPRSAVHMVPGNHDVSRADGVGLARTLADPGEAQRYFHPDFHRHHMAKLQAFRDFYNRFYAADPALGGAAPRAAPPYQATAGPEVVKVRGLSLGVLPLNTAWFAQDDEDAGKLLVGEVVVREGLQRLSSLGADLRLALMHHPLSDLSYIERKLVQERLQEGCHFLLRGHLHDTEAHSISPPGRQLMVLAAGAGYQGRVHYQNRALYVEAELDAAQKQVLVRPYPIRYELTGHDRWTLDTSIFPRSYPTYLETLTLSLAGPGH